MRGICKSCGGQTTNTRAKSKSGECFSCEHGFARVELATPREASIEDRLSSIEHRLDNLEAEKFRE